MAGSVVELTLTNEGVNKELIRATLGWIDENTQDDYTHTE